MDAWNGTGGRDGPGGLVDDDANDSCLRFDGPGLDPLGSIKGNGARERQRQEFVAGGPSHGTKWRSRRPLGLKQLNCPHLGRSLQSRNNHSPILCVRTRMLTSQLRVDSTSSSVHVAWR